MITDKVPRKASEKEEYRRSDAMILFAALPPGDFSRLCAQLEAAMKREDRRQIQIECAAIATLVSAGFGVKPPTVRVLGVRPLEEAGEGYVDETYGDYEFENACIRLWMRTAVLEKMTSFGTLLSTLLHELCHHLDLVKYDLPNTFHTRGFYERAGQLYHHVRGTPVRKLVWEPLSGGTFRINWPQTMRGQKAVGR